MTTVRYAGYVDGKKQTITAEYDDLEQVTIMREAFEELLINLSRPFTVDDDD